GTLITVAPVNTTTYAVTGSDNNCSKKISVPVTVNECTGITKQSEQEEVFSIYPNPNTGEFNIEIAETGHFEAEIYNSLGQKIYTNSGLTPGNNKINLGAKKGVY